MEEIEEFKAQLLNVQKELAENPNEELQTLETELKELIKELQPKEDVKVDSEPEPVVPEKSNKSASKSTNKYEEPLKSEPDEPQPNSRGSNATKLPSVENPQPSKPVPIIDNTPSSWKKFQPKPSRISKPQVQSKSRPAKPQPKSNKPKPVRRHFIKE